MRDFEILHNPHCSKSRATLALLQARGIEPRVLLYLETPPSIDELRQLLRRLGMSARDILRSDEAAYRAAGLGNPELDEHDLLAAIHAQPILLQRPIVRAGERAVIGRPPENVLALI